MKFFKIILLVFVSSVCQMFGQNVGSSSLDISLFPQQNEIRNTLNISGVWKFQKDSLQIGEKQKWQYGLKDYRSIAVPGSWNEQFADSRDYLGMVWYEKETFVPSSWKGQRIFIRVGSATYAAKVWINGQLLGSHEGGNLPFVFEIGEKIQWGKINRISIQVENLLKPNRVPTGNVKGGPFTSFPETNYDFFPFSGLHRDVWIYTLPKKGAIKDLTIKTNFKNTTGKVFVNILTDGQATKGKIIISGADKKYESTFVLNNNKATVEISIPQVRLWSPEDPYLYNIDVVIEESNKILDHYSLDTGVRTITATDKQILLNGKPIVLKGFGKHEDFPVIGRGASNPVMVKDFSLMKWVGANSFRTSHYPYDEEYMKMADREGFLVINEIPAVGLFFHGDTTELAKRQTLCKQYINELIARDKNHPSVILWCVANEPFPKDISTKSIPEDRVATPKSIELFKELFALVKEKDDTRLSTLVGVMGGPKEWLGLGDVISINRYYGWYTHTGDLKSAIGLLNRELDGLHKIFNKPVILTEFGADAYPGMHAEQDEMFTEEFQVQFLKAYLDLAATKDYIAGTHVWAFSDFKTGQAIIRFGGVNYKGVFTRDRKPKAAAYYLRSIWNKN